MLSSPMIRGLLGVAAVMAVSACDDGNSYPKEVRQTFMANCKAGSPEPLCGCVLSALEKKYTYAQYQELEQRVIRGEAAAHQEVQAMRQQCAPAPEKAATGAGPRSLGDPDRITTSIVNKPKALGLCNFRGGPQAINDQPGWMCEGQHAYDRRHQFVVIGSADMKSTLDVTLRWQRTDLDTPVDALADALELTEADRLAIRGLLAGNMPEATTRASSGATIRVWSTVPNLPGFHRLSIYTGREPVPLP